MTQQNPRALPPTEYAAELEALAQDVGGILRQGDGDILVVELGDGCEIANEDGTFDVWMRVKPDRVFNGDGLSLVATGLDHDEVRAWIKERDRGS
jgi:hypothetical protein